MRKFSSKSITFLAALLLAGCGGQSAVTQDTADDGDVVVTEEPVTVVTGDTTGDDATTTGLDGETGSGGQGLGGDEESLAQVIYFDYDSSLLSADGRAMARAHAEYLAGAADLRIILEGHADERGTREYNLALAEDRAKSVADVIQAWGINSSRIQTVSYGEERPVALGHDESAWGLNRRVEILYQ